jgi:hypothetical protein
VANFFSKKFQPSASTMLQALRDNDAKAVQQLLDSKASVNKMRGVSETPLILASIGTDIETMKVLLGAKADVSCGDNFGVPPLTFVATGFCTYHAFVRSKSGPTTKRPNRVNISAANRLSAPTKRRCVVFDGSQSKCR